MRTPNVFDRCIVTVVLVICVFGVVVGAIFLMTGDVDPIIVNIVGVGGGIGALLVLAIILQKCSPDSQTPVEPTTPRQDPPPDYKDTWGKQFYNNINTSSDQIYNSNTYQSYNNNDSVYIISTRTTDIQSNQTSAPARLQLYARCMPETTNVKYPANDFSPVNVRNSIHIDVQQLGNSSDTQSLPSYAEALLMMKNNNCNQT